MSKPKIGIPLYVLVLPPNRDGTPNHYTGRYRSREWVKGVSIDVMSKLDAQRYSLATGCDYALFKIIPATEIHEWREVYDNPDPVPDPETTTYQQQTKLMKEAGYDWLDATGGDRSSDAVKEVFKNFVEENYGEPRPV